MPNQPAGTVDLSGSPAPLDEATFDSLFPAESTPTATPATPSAQPNPPAQAAPTGNPNPAAQPSSAPAATPSGNPTAPFLKADRTVYNSAEAAIKGINEKDAIIEQLRTRYALTTGIDPITGQPVTQAPQAPPNDYYNNPSQYLDDLYKAAKEGGPEAYRDVQAKFVIDSLAPVRPLLQKAARDSAVESVSKDVKEIGSFIGTPQYNKALDENPELKAAIATAETDFRFHSRLPGLYKLAYLSGQGLQLPELLKAQAQPAPSSNPPAPPRPTLQPTTRAPETSPTQPNMRSIEGIRAIIRESEAKGLKLEF